MKTFGIAHFAGDDLFGQFTQTFGAGLGAYFSGLTKNESLAIGFGMNARGAMEIILATLALQAGLIDAKMFVALVIMALVTSMMSGPFMKWFLDKDAEKLKN